MAAQGKAESGENTGGIKLWTCRQQKKRVKIWGTCGIFCSHGICSCALHKRHLKACAMRAGILMPSRILKKYILRLSYGYKQNFAVSLCPRVVQRRRIRCAELHICSVRSPGVEPAAVQPVVMWTPALGRFLTKKINIGKKIEN